MPVYKHVFYSNVCISFIISLVAYRNKLGRHWVFTVLGGITYEYYELLLVASEQQNTEAHQYPSQRNSTQPFIGIGNPKT
jgi:hypothetical protein